MGGGNSKDGGRLHYRVHNIYLNFVETYGRLPPNKKLTMHQKALFCFWVSIIALLITLQIIKLIRKIRTYTAGRSCDDDQIEIATDQETLLEEDLPVEPKKEPFHHKVYGLFKATSKEQPPFEPFLFKLCMFGAIMFYFWLCDHLHLWPKVNKQYSRDVFVFLFAILLITSFVFTIRTNKDKLINRDQTEEWKGWMQVQFVWYHYFDAQEVYNSIRCYIAGYVWMTGFGNLTYFWSREDYSLYRLLKMMFRLNFLVVVVMAVTNHEFVRYYICAMHTYWFLSVWAVLVVFKKYNSNRIFMAVKFLIYTIINSLIFDIPGASAKVFIPFNFILHDANGGLTYWIYRATLDHWTTMVGMLVAYNYPYYERFMIYLDKKDDRQTNLIKLSLRITISVISVAVFVIWFYWILLMDRNTYLKVHPYTSPIPILVYVWLRNVHPVLRTHHLQLLTWLGKITLETYLSQIHMYMMGDAKNIIVYLPNYPLMNFMLSTAIYLFVSQNLFKMTVFFSSYLLPKDWKVIGKHLIIFVTWFACCYLLSYILTAEHAWGQRRTGLEFLRWSITKTKSEAHNLTTGASAMAH